MFCINCGKELPDDAKFCSGCGKQIEVKKEETVNTVPVCSSCGEKLISGNKFCTKCGATIEGLSNNQNNSNEATKEDQNFEQSKRLWEEGLRLRDNGSLDSAIQKFTESINLYPHPSSYLCRGFSYLAIDWTGENINLELVIQDMSNVIALDPYAGGAYYLRGIANHSLFDSKHNSEYKEKAIADLEKALSLGCEIGFADAIGVNMADTQWARNHLNILKKGALKGTFSNLFG